jgi:hypothetical protein
MAAGTARPATGLGRIPSVWLATGIGLVVTGWVLAVGALVFEFGIPAWAVAVVGLEVTVGVALAAVILARPPALLVWWTSATGLAVGWVAYVAVAGPWTWTGEVSLVLPAAVLTLLWPAANAHAARRSPRSP